MFKKSILYSWSSSRSMMLSLDLDDDHLSCILDHHRGQWCFHSISMTIILARRFIIDFFDQFVICLSQMSNDTQFWVSLFLKRKLSENLGTESSIPLFSKAEYHLTSWVDFLQTFRSYFFQSAVFMNIISNSKTSNCIFRKMLNIEILKSFASANQFKHQNHQFSSLELIYARWLFHILWKT